MSNEMRLIDANVLKRRIIGAMELSKTQAIDKDDVAFAIDNSDAVDAKPVVHGRWIHITEDGEGGCYGFCSNCSTEHHAQSASALKAFHRYCRWCGADMR